MQYFSKKIYSVILAVCLIASSLCFDVKADNFMHPFSPPAQSVSVIATGSSISDEDACTVEMLGNVHASLLTQHLALKHSGHQSESETVSILLKDAVNLSASSKFVLLTNLDLVTEDTDSAEILQFIHNKDGKKKI